MKNIYRFLTVLLLFLGSMLYTNNANASHVAGGYIQFECTGTPGVYNVRLVLYRDCSGITLSTSNKTINFTNSCGLANVSASLSYISSQEVSQVCINEANNTTCNGGSLPGYQEYIFEGTVNLGTCDSWIATYTVCNRNNITNIVNGSWTCFEVTTEIYTATDDCNTTPTVTGQPEPFVCNNQPVSYNPGAFEPDGDSIVYSLVPALDGGASVTYQTGYSATSPIPGVTIDPQTGTVSYTPSQTGNFLFVIQITEYNSNGDIVSQTNYEYQTYVVDCTNQLPEPPDNTPGGGISNITGSIIQNGPNDVTFCEGNSGCFDVVFSDPDAGDVLTVQSNVTSVMPGATVTQTGTNPVTVTVCWTPTGISGSTPISFLVEDDACPLVGQNNYGATVNVVPSASATVSTTTETCGGTDEGTASISVTGGSPPFTYDITGPVNATNGTGNFANLPPGNYNYTVSGTAGCDVTGNFTIVAGPPLPLTVTGTDLSCNGAGDGSVTANPSGVAPYNFVWSQGGTPIGQTTQTASNLAAGTYDVDIVDNNGCIASGSVTITEPTPIVGSLTPTDALCNGDATGEVDVTGVSGGTAPYTYSINAGAPQGGTNFSGLAAGNYQVEIEDSHGCTLILNTTVGEPTPLVLSVDNVGDASCGTNSGSIQVSASGGDSSPAYQFSNGPSNNASGTFNNLAPGTYNVTVTDGSGCTDNTSITIGTSPAPTAFVDNQVNLSCFGGNNGEVIIGTTGALAPITYSLDGGPGQPSNQFTGLAAGNHTVDITDAIGCTASVSFTITQPTVLAYTSTPSPASCNGACDGEIAISASGGTAPYQYSSNNGLSFGPSSTLTGLCAGTINVVVKDFNGCLTNSTVNITEPGALNATFVNTDPTCHNGSDGSIAVSVTGGSPTFQYSVDGGALQPGNNLTGLSAGSHNIIVEDVNGCQFNATQTLGNPPPITITVASMTESNCGFNDGAIDLSASGVNPPFQYSLNGSPNQPSGSFTNMIAGSYLAVVTDNLGCTDSLFVGINDIQMSGTLLDSTNITCFGGSDGSVTVTNTAGAAPITYELDNSGSTQTSGTFNGLQAGNHIVTIYDAGFCIFTIPFELSQPNQMTFSANTTDVACNGGATGQIDVINPAGGTGAFQYSIDGGFTFQPSPSFTGLATGNYTIVAMDVNGCFASNSYQINEAPLITYTTNLIDLNCNGDNTGVIQIVASGGTGTYTYSNDGGGTFQASNTFVSLAAGSYNLAVQDAAGCQVTSTGNITEPAPLTSTYTPQDATCFGVCDGQLTFTASGGTTPYNYSIDNGVTLTTNNVVTGICAGTFTAYVEDDHGCTITASQTINEPTQVAFTSSETPSTCSDPNGQISISASGGTPTYTYSVDNGVTFAPGSTFTGLAEGTYTIVVRDNNGCEATNTQDVTDQPSPTITMLQGTDPLCNGDANGEIEVTATGGTGTLSYAVDGGAPQASNVLTGLTAGSHLVEVTDGNGCTDTMSITLTQPVALTLVATPTPLTCYQNSTGSVSISPSGGTPMYQYSFDNGVTYGSSNTINFVAAGTYNVALKDAHGCITTGTATVTEPTELVFDNVTVIDALCKSSQDGSIAVTVSGGTPNYTYTWSGGVAGSTDDIATGLGAGSYNLTVEDGNGCQIFVDTVVNEPDSVEITNFNITNVTCNGDCDGQLIVNSPTATEFSIDGGATFQASNTFSNLCANIYSVVARDANGCVVPRNAEIWQAGPMALSMTDDTTVCYGYNYTIHGNPSGGIQPYTYQWNPVSSSADSLSIIATATETYTLTVFDFNGCPSNLDSTVISVIPLVDITVLKDTTICPGGTATLTAQGVDGLPAYDYTWSTGETTSIIQVTPGTMTTYTATVTDQCGDQASADATVSIHDLPQVNFSADSLVGCIPQTVNFTNLTDPSMVGTNCVWTIDGQNIAGCDTISYTFTEAGCYDINLSVASPFGCVNDTTFNDYICIDPFPIADFSYSPEFPTLINSLVDFTNASIDAETYNWTFEGEGTSTEVNPSVTFGYVEPEDGVTICLEAFSEYGCKDEICKDIIFKDAFAIYVPNTFTPDNDDYNETFKPMFPPDRKIHEYHLTIFNRWGEIVFESFDKSVGWDGTYGATLNTKVQDGVFVWKIQLTEGPDYKDRSFTGHVTLLK